MPKAASTVAMVGSSLSWTASAPGVNFCTTMPSKLSPVEERPEPAGELDEVVAEDAEERAGVEMAAGEPRRWPRRGGSGTCL